MTTIRVEVDGKSVYQRKEIKGHYWRDFTGEIPEDAFVAGLDSNGNPVYIGQALHEKSLLPGQIKPADKHIYFEYWDKGYTATKNVKIFCTLYQENYKWVGISTPEFNRLKAEHVIPGGFQPDFTVYIGRIVSGSEAWVGKGLVWNNGTIQMRDGKGVWHNSYEVLCYDSQCENPLEKSMGRLSCDARVININIS